MSEIENPENELEPRLQQMLKAYGTLPERDPESAGRGKERFIAIMNVIFDEQTSAPSVPERFPFSSWSSIFNRLRETFVGSRRMRVVLTGLVLLAVFAISAFGGVGIIAAAASSSLPGDAFYPLKTRIENARAGLIPNPAARARLYTEFAGRRLSEIQLLMDKGRYSDIAQATGEYEMDIQRAVNAIDGLSQTDPTQAVAVRAEIAAILRGYAGLLSQMSVGLPGDVQLFIEDGILSSQLAAERLDFDDDSNDDEDAELNATPSSQPDHPPQAPASPQPLPQATATVQATATGIPTLVVTAPPPAASTAIPPATQPAVDSPPVIQSGDGTCQGFLGAVTVENLEVPEGTSCTLTGTRVQGNIFIRNGASLLAQDVMVNGNIQAEGAHLIEVLAGSSVGGSIQLKQGGSARVESVMVTGDIQFESHNGTLSAAGNQVGGNIQVFQNAGGITIAGNFVNGNLQCKENSPAPGGGNNTVQGNKEDQCAGL
jgi:hypothetical protein